MKEGDTFIPYQINILTHVYLQVRYERIAINYTIVLTRKNTIYSLSCMCKCKKTRYIQYIFFTIFQHVTNINSAIT